MPNLKSGEKELRKSKKRRVANLQKSKALKSAIKNARRTIVKDAKAAEKDLASVYKVIDKSSKSHIISKKTGNRLKSRITKSINKKK